MSLNLIQASKAKLPSVQRTHEAIILALTNFILLNHPNGSGIMPKPCQQEEKNIITHPGFSGWIPLLGGDFCWIIHQLIYGPHTKSNNPPRAPQLKGPERCHIPAERASSLGNCLWNAPTGSTVPIDEGTLPLSKKVLESWTLMGERRKEITVHVTQYAIYSCFYDLSLTCPHPEKFTVKIKTNMVEALRLIFFLAVLQYQR